MTSASEARRDGHVTYRNTPVLDFLPAADMLALFIAGAHDPLGRVEGMRTAFEAWGTADKRFLVLGREHGARSTRTATIPHVARAPRSLRAIAQSLAAESPAPALAS